MRGFNIKGGLLHTSAFLALQCLSIMNDEPERETVLFTACREVAQAAIARVASCEACNPDAAEDPVRDHS